MRNVISSLNRHRRALLSAALRHGSYAESISRKSTLLGAPKKFEIAGTRDDLFPSCLLQRYRFSTGFTSVHGGTASSEYAKLRKESLESEFGHIIGTHSSKRASAVYRFGPFLAVYRATIISYHVFKLIVWRLFVGDIRKRAIKLRDMLISLGPFYVKLGQALSTRQDILPPVYCQELAKLQDRIPPFSTRVARKLIETELGVPVSDVFADISPEPIAAASLGQVYKAHLHSGELVAVKVQRPGMSLRLTLDALLFHMIGGQLKRFAKARKDLLVAVNEVVRHMFDEIDYVLEARNAERFASLYGWTPGNEQMNHPSDKVKNLMGIKVPKIYWDFTRRTVLTMEWVDGIKLTDDIGLEKACLNRKELIDQGLYCSLRQLLEVGFFHADPHPGNLVALNGGYLAYFDFGMMGEIPRHYRVGLIQVLVHFVNRDALALANDFLSLGFLPDDVDVESVANALLTSFGDGTRQSQDFQAIMEQLYDVMYDFDFSLPPDYALVVRALGSLEGTAKVLDPGFKVIESSYPFVIGRLLADPNPDMRRILRELVIRDNGSIRWNRLERLVAAISEQASETTGKPPNSGENSSNILGWKSFDMRAVVSATEDLFHFILSEKGLRVRVFLLRDIIQAANVFLEEEVCMIKDESKETKKPESERVAMIRRVANGFRSLQQAIKLAPELWTSMFFRMASKPEFHSFSLDIISALCTSCSRKLPETFWVCLSRLLHKSTTKNYKSEDHRR